MSGMKISLDAAMRARDVSKPTAADEADAELTASLPRTRPEQPAAPAASRAARAVVHHRGHRVQRPAGPPDPEFGPDAAAEVVPPRDSGTEPAQSQPGRAGRPRRRGRSRLGMLGVHGRKGLGQGDDRAPRSGPEARTSDSGSTDARTNASSPPQERNQADPGSGGSWPVRS